MTGLDTNVSVRCIMQDDPKRSPEAVCSIESLKSEAPSFFSLVLVVGHVWVLSSSYELTRLQVAGAIESLLRSQEMSVDRAELIAKALRVSEAGKAVFADCLIERISHGAGCKVLKALDVQASRSAGMSLIA